MCQYSAHLELLRRLTVPALRQNWRHFSTRQILRYQNADSPRPSKKELQEFLGWVDTGRVDELIHDEHTVQLLRYLVGLKVKYVYHRLPSINRDIERCVTFPDLWGANHQDAFFDDCKAVLLHFVDTTPYEIFRIGSGSMVPYTAVERAWLAMKFSTIAIKYNSNITPLKWNETDEEPQIPARATLSETPALCKSARSIRKRVNPEETPEIRPAYKS